MHLVEEMVYFRLQVTDPLRGARAGVQGRNVEAGTKAEATEEHCSEASKLTISYLPYVTRPTCQEVILSTVGWSFFHQLARKCTHRHVHRPIQWRLLFNKGSLFPGMTS